MSKIEVYVHFVWSTKYRYPFLDSAHLRNAVWFHIKQYAAQKGINVLYVNGFSDHCHCLVALKSNQKLEDIMKMIKGESSWWINRNNLTARKFQWQREYYSCAISKTLVERVRNYLKSQEKRHG